MKFYRDILNRYTVVLTDGRTITGSVLNEGGLETQEELLAKVEQDLVEKGLSPIKECKGMTTIGMGQNLEIPYSIQGESMDTLELLAEGPWIHKERRN